MKKVILILVLIFFNILFAAAKIQESEGKPGYAKEEEKIKILLELAEKYGTSDPQQAAEYNRQAFRLLQKYANNKLKIQEKYETEKKVKEIELLKEKEKRSDNLIKFYFIVTFLISLTAVINFLRYRGKKRTAETVRESEQIYRELVNRANDGIAIIQDGHIKFVNPEVANILGYPPEELIGHAFDPCIVPEERERLRDIYRRRLAGKEVDNTYETLLLHKNGYKVNVEINSGLISYADRPAALVFIHNTGMRKLLEEERIKRSKLEAVGSLAGGIAHDFNNLLAVILGNIELARLFPKSEKKIAAILNKVEKAALKARDLTKRFLTFSEGGAPFKKTTSLQSIIREAVDITMSGTREEFRLKIAADLWQIDCDEEQIYQVFSSLIANAAEAMDKNGAITIEAENLEVKSAMAPLKPGKYVKISVKDEGEGIPEEHLSKIFDPYFSTRGRVSQKGLGFGLSIVYTIIKQHDGYIEVESKVKEGTTVIVYLPIR